jgi:tetratricopeptide (TPR) repeat protein
MGDKEGALDDYTQIIQLTPNYHQLAPVYTEKYLTLAHNQRGQILLAIGNIAKAEKDFTKAIAINPNYGEPYLGRAFALSALGNKQQAETDYSSYLRFYPTDSKSYYYRGVVRHQLGNLEGALADYDQAIRLNDKFSAAYYNRGIIHDNLGNVNAALDDYQQALGLNQEIFITDNRPRARGYHQRGIVFARLAERLVHSAEKEVIPEESTIAGYYCDASINTKVSEKLTQAYSEAEGYYTQAIEDYKEAIRYDSNLESFEYARAFRDRGYIYSRQGDRQKAIQDFNQAIYVNNKYAPAYFARGCVRAEGGDYQGAIGDYNRAIRYGRGKDKERTVAIRQDLNPDFDKAESYYQRGQVS